VTIEQQGKLTCSISSLLTLAGLEDPSTAPSFQSVVLDQIKNLRKQLEEDEESARSKSRMHPGQPAEYFGGVDEGEEEVRMYGEFEHSEMLQVGESGLPQMMASGPRGRGSPLIIQGQ
jgi:hypothetical protein